MSARLLGFAFSIAIGVTTACATVIGEEDGRGLLTALGPKLGLSKKEIVRIRSATGFVVCPGKANNNGIVGSGFLVRSDRVLVTAAHIIVDSKTGKLRGPVTECYFAKNQPNMMKPVKIKFEVSSKDIYLGRLKRPEPLGNDQRDFAVIRLAQSVKDARPYLRSDSVADMGLQGMEILVVSAGQIAVSHDYSEPIVQKCFVKDHMTDGGWVTDCDADPMASGGPALMADGSRYSMVLGLVATTGKEKLKNTPYNPSSSQFTSLVSMQGVWPVVEAMATERELPPGNAYRPE